MKQHCPIAGIILSGGASRRMGTPKALLKYQDETFLDRLIGLFAVVCDPVIVVLGHQSEQIRAGSDRIGQAVVTVNPDPERGMLSSLQCGLQAVPAGVEAVMFMPVDHPNIERSTLETLGAAYLAGRAPVTVPTHAGLHGHPVCIASPLVAELLALPPSARASDIIHRYVAQTNYVEVSDPAVTLDIDDPAGYDALVGARP